MPLNLADKNKIYIIQRIVGNKDMVHRLQSLGFVVGSKISVLSEINGNYVVVIKDIKIGLAKEYVKRLLCHRNGFRHLLTNGI